MLRDIRAKYSCIRNNIYRYEEKKIDISDDSTEGGEVVAYYDGTELKIIQMSWFGETGKRILEFYIVNGEVFFAFDQHFNYNRPIYWNESLAKENEDDEVFNPEKTTVSEDRYYFNKNRLFMWLNHDSKSVALSAESSKPKENELIEYFQKVKNNINKSASD
ncbi:hypothetical protein [Saccharicrinis sp. FJH54]|uniref:hypothetical protein n=1 Tax=Saccharicrinis sp. FJH54 TaxID=3344665 RepID=UPI0035D51807